MNNGPGQIQGQPNKNKRNTCYLWNRLYTDVQKFAVLRKSEERKVAYYAHTFDGSLAKGQHLTNPLVGVAERSTKRAFEGSPQSTRQARTEIRSRVAKALSKAARIHSRCRDQRNP